MDSGILLMDKVLLDQATSWFFQNIFYFIGQLDLLNILWMSQNALANTYEPVNLNKKKMPPFASKLIYMLHFKPF